MISTSSSGKVSGKEDSRLSVDGLRADEFIGRHWVATKGMSGEGYVILQFSLLPEVSMIRAMVTVLPEVREKGTFGDFIKAWPIEAWVSAANIRLPEHPPGSGNDLLGTMWWSWGG